MDEYYLSMGGCVLTDDNKSGFDDPNTIKAMEFVDKCVKNVMPPASTMSETGTDVLFGSGKVAMISQGSWMVSAFKDNDYIKEHCDVARLPKTLKQEKAYLFTMVLDGQHLQTQICQTKLSSLLSGSVPKICRRNRLTLV